MIIKVCGLRDAENIRAVEAAGADWTGFIFYDQSPRFVGEMPAYLPTRCKRVGVFVDAPTETLLGTARQWGLSALQLHGRETPQQCAELMAQGLCVVKALHVGTKEDLAAAQPYEGRCHYLLFDTPSVLGGGSGRAFDWRLLHHYRGRTPFLLSGGLSPDSLDALLQFRHPRLAGFDLNSGFETSPGAKDAAALKKFIHTYREHRLWHFIFSAATQRNTF